MASQNLPVRPKFDCRQFFRQELDMLVFFISALDTRCPRKKNIFFKSQYLVHKRSINPNTYRISKKPKSKTESKIVFDDIFKTVRDRKNKAKNSFALKSKVETTPWQPFPCARTDFREKG